MKTLRHLIEAFFVYLIFYTFKMIGIDFASFIGGWIGRTIGPLVKASEIAKHNLNLCFPEMTEKEKKKIILGMWENLGRMVGELPHLASMSEEEFNRRIKFINLPKRLPKAGLFVSGHFANFELPARLSRAINLNLFLVHRPANNPYVNRLINNQRTKYGIKMISKGNAGVKQMVQIAQQKNAIIGMLIDQKTNTGIEVPFFGRPVKTTPFPANLALKYNLPIYLTKIKRIKAATFEVSLIGPLKISKKNTDVEIMSMINEELESWIRENPEQWFWVHRRWGKV